LRGAGRKRRFGGDEGDAGTGDLGGEAREIGAVGGGEYRPVGPDDAGWVAAYTVMFSVVAAELPEVHAVGGIFGNEVK
jgi:hypothetical protein